ncbi:hypothetical protein [Candidatus Protochlamydia amoebophila]|uniref:Uncharacterized protein n=1 Tax=Candidatus Protochlamydia amoebophila TaxID=362787 RepID=A0A0C1H4E7_9BACT|nr:hypothetical protein [Candidatus Protochlamydia amoebophila]KIC72404.1 hypothetical protein DB44_CJ00180 [Candidatus Protochlamydia amoebophila]
MQLSTFINFAVPTIRGLDTASAIRLELNDEQAHRQGRNHIAVAIQQMELLNQALRQVKYALIAAGNTNPLRGMTVVVIGAPMLVSWLASQEFNDLRLRKVVNFAQSHLPTLSVAISVISTLALWIFHQRIQATAFLILTTIGFLDRHCFLPAQMHSPLNYMMYSISNIAGMIWGNTLNRLFCVINLVSPIVDYFFKSYRDQLNQENRQLNQENRQTLSLPASSNPEQSYLNVSLQDLENLTNQSQYAVNPVHLKQTVLPSIQVDAKLDQILDYLADINWDNHQIALSLKLRDDERWSEIARGTISEQDYFKQNLKAFIKSIKNRDMVGPPQNYQMLDFYCKFIAQELRHQDEMSRADILLKLGIEGGQYCGIGKFRVVEEVFHSLISQSEALPLQQRIFATLFLERTRMFQAVYQTVLTSNLFSYLLSKIAKINDVHKYNICMNMAKIGTQFGVAHQAALNDENAYIAPIFKIFPIFDTTVRKLLWEGGVVNSYSDSQTNGRWVKSFVYLKPYDQITIINHIQTTIGTPQIPKADIYQWWSEWIDRQEVEVERKQSLKEELTMEGKLQGENLEMNGKIQNKFLIAMLQEMGILLDSAVAPISIF